jgi:lysophospholipase L1-like esterase
MAGTAKKVAKCTGATLLAVVLGTAAFEGVLRVGLIDNPKFAFEDAARRWDESSHRLLILGDSFIVPFGLLARLLDEDFREHDVAVRNMAVSGTGPFEYLERLQQFGRTGQRLPDAVLLSYYAGNDLTDVQDNPRFSPDATSTAIRTGAPGIPTLAADRWYHAFNLFHYLEPKFAEPPPRPVIDWNRYLESGVDPELVEQAKTGGVNRWLFELASRNPHHLLDNILMETERNQLAWARGRELLSAIHDACREQGVELMLVMFPRSIQIDDSHFEFFERLKFDVDERTLSSRAPQDRMSELCAERGIPMLDLLPAFEGAGANLYLPNDDHLNREGHHFAAERIVPWVLGHLE